MIDHSDQFSVDANNPLLASLPPERSFLEWGIALSYDPRDKWSKPYGKRPESHARIIRNLVVPTERLVTVAVNFQGALINSYRERDPRLPANRRRLYELAELKANKKLDEDLTKLPWFAGGAPGSIIQGPTGVQKSHSVSAFLGQFPQVIEHGTNAECGWSSLKQIVYLQVAMPDDANRKSFYLAIVLEIDRHLGTNHAPAVEKMTNGRALLEVLTLLSVYRCGLLVVEEAQMRNLASKVLGNEFVATFLRIMNCGVPLVLVGNPLAFENVLNFSQDTRRFSAEGIYDFAPVYAADDPEWLQDLVPGVWGWTIFDEKDAVPPDQLAPLLFKRTGGCADFLSRYRCECLINAIRRGASRVEARDVEDAYWSAKIKPLHGLATAYATHKIDLLSKYTDQPLDYLQGIWSYEKARRRPQKKGPLPTKEGGAGQGGG